MADTTEKSAPKRGISRRTVVQGTAWAVPAVVVATAAPAMAAGTSQCVGVTFEGSSCKQPGNGQNEFNFRLFICFTNACGSQITLKLTKIQGNTGNSPVKTINQTFTIPANSKTCTAEIDYCSNNSASKINVYFTVNGGVETFVQVDSPPNCPDGTVIPCT